MLAGLMSQCCRPQTSTARPSASRPINSASTTAACTGRHLRTARWPNGHHASRYRLPHSGPERGGFSRFDGGFPLEWGQFVCLDGGRVTMHHARPRMLGGLLLTVLATATARAQDCSAPGAWFPHAQTPKPTDAVAGDDDCSFHRWSWQTFLWLTQTVDGKPRFIAETFTPDQVF